MLIRSTVLSIRELDYVLAARALGRRDLAIAFRHILPNCIGPLLVQASFIFAYAILAEAILGFLGVGVPPYVPSWGNVIASGKNVIREAFWVSLFPGLALTISGLSLNLLGDGLRDVWTRGCAYSRKYVVRAAGRRGAVGRAAGPAGGWGPQARGERCEEAPPSEASCSNGRGGSMSLEQTLNDTLTKAIKEKDARTA